MFFLYRILLPTYLDLPYLIANHGQIAAPRSFFRASTCEPQVTAVSPECGVLLMIVESQILQAPCRTRPERPISDKKLGVS